MHVHCNMQLQLQIPQWENKQEFELIADLFDSSFIEDDSHLMINWWLTFDDQDPIMDESDDTPYHSQYIELIERDNAGE